jgi:hypothetical protein
MKKVISEPENGHNPPILEHRYWASKSLTNQITCRNLVLLSNVHTSLFQKCYNGVLTWFTIILVSLCFLKHNKYIFDISIPFCHHLYLSATFKNFSIFGKRNFPGRWLLYNVSDNKMTCKCLRFYLLEICKYNWLNQSLLDSESPPARKIPFAKYTEIFY